MKTTTVDALIPAHFIDDGCTNWPDKICGSNMKPACRRHDFKYCSRCHDEMSPLLQQVADLALRVEIREALPWWSQWTRWPVFWALRLVGNFAYDSCGTDEELCRHGMRIT